MKRTKVFSLLLLLFAGAVLNSCNKSKPTWDTNILAPLVNVSMSVNNLVTGNTLKTNPDSSVTLVFNDSLYSLNMDSLFRIHDTTILNGFPSPITHTFNPGDTIYPANVTTTNYGVGTSVELKEAIVQSGYAEFEIRSFIKGPTDFTYTVPDLTLGGVPLQISAKVAAASGSGPGTYTQIVPLNNYKVDFTGLTHNGYNTVITKVQGILDPSASPTLVNFGDSIQVKATFYSIVPYYGLGYFGTSTRSEGPSTSAFSLFRKFVSGSISLQDVTVNLTLQNGFGVDARINISQLTSINRSGIPYFLTDLSLINNAINVNAATQTYNPASPVKPSMQTFNITPGNSNILNWIDNLPVNIGYALQVTTDPLGNVSGSNDFAFNGYGIKANLGITVPLSLVANNLTLADTAQINLSSKSSADQQVKSGTFTIYADNGFPFSAGIQVYLLDAHAHIVDSLLSPMQTITAGILIGPGVVNSPTSSILTFQLDAARMQELFNTKTIIIMARFNMSCPTCTPPYVQIYDTYKLNLKVVGNFDYLVKG